MHFLNKWLSHKIVGNYFHENSRLSWAPFSSVGLVGQVPQHYCDFNQLLKKIFLYFGGESIDLIDACKFEERAKKLLENEVSVEKDPHLESIGYYYGETPFPSKVEDYLKAYGKIIWFLPVKDRAHASSSGNKAAEHQELLEEAYKIRAKENCLLITDYEVRTDLLGIISKIILFVTGHEAPVMVDDLIKNREIFPDEALLAAKKLNGQCVSDCKKMSLTEFSDFIENDGIIDSNSKMYRIN